MSRIFKPISDIRKEKRRAKIVTRTRIVVAVVLCILLFYVLVSYSGHWLVRDDSFEHVNWVVVLDGQSGDLERSDYAAKLVREGKADSVLILGRRVFRDKNNADFYAEDMEEVGGVDPSRIYIYRHDDPSTIEEAVSVIPWFKRRAPKDTVYCLRPLRQHAVQRSSSIRFPVDIPHLSRWICTIGVTMQRPGFLNGKLARTGSANGQPF